MQTLSGALTTHLSQASTTMATYVHVVRTDGTIYAWTTHDRDQTIDGVVFLTAQGVQMTAVHLTDDMRTSTIDVSVFLGASTEAEIAAGVWDNAEIVLFEANWQALPAVLFDTDCVILLSGVVGAIRRQDNTMLAEVRDLTQVLNTRIGRTYSYTCPWRHARWNGTTYVADAECGVSLAGHIHDGSVTAVDDARQSFYDTASTQVDGYYNFGLLTFTSGLNAGLTFEVAAWNADFFILARQVPHPISVGNTYRAVRGDDRQWQTCRTTYSNLVNFGGFPYMPGQDRVFGIPQAVAS